MKQLARNIIVGAAIVASIAIASCATTKGYTICDDYNTTCPNNTANVVIDNGPVGM